MIIQYQRKTIINATSEYIDIRDNDGVIYHILFHECVSGWMKYIKSSTDFNAIHDVDVTSKCVAITHGIRRDLYIELTWTPFVRIEFKQSWRLWQPFDAFLHTQQLIHQLGWQTYDMS